MKQHVHGQRRQGQVHQLVLDSDADDDARGDDDGNLSASPRPAKAPHDDDVVGHAVGER